MANVRANSMCLRTTVLSALLILFFVQLVTIWIESIYRLSLIKLGPGIEMLGLLLLFLPVLLLFVGKNAQRSVCGLSVLALLTARALCPFFGVRGLVVVSGIGVAAALVIVCFMLSGRYRFFRGDLGLGVGIAVLLSVALRAWGSSFDVSMGKQGAVLCWGLVAIALLLLRGGSRDTDSAGALRQESLLTRTGALVLLFSSLTLIYLVLSSPAVVTAWSGSNYLAGTTILAVALACSLGWYSAGMPGPLTLSRGFLVGWNLVFIACLILGIKLHTVALPLTPDAPAVVVAPSGWLSLLPLYLMFALSPVVVFNILVATERSLSDDPRAQVLPVLVGMAFLVTVTFILIFTNIWGYVRPFSLAFRNRFYLPFLIAGAGMLFPLLLPVWRGVFPVRKSGGHATPLAVGAALVAALAVAGIVFRAARPQYDSNADTLTVCTYNMQLGSENEGDRNWRDQIAFLRKVDADIVGLQESDAARPSGGNVDVARLFADALGYHAYYGPNAISGTFGTAILSRFPLENCRTHFTYSTVDEVGTAMADIEVGGRRIGLFNNHPAGPLEVMESHAKNLVSAYAGYDDVISVGDYNFRQTSSPYAIVTAVLSDSWLRLNPTGVGTVHPQLRGDSPEGAELDMTGRIDHIFISPDIEVIESYYVPTPDSQTDHPAHWSVLRLP
ncbi:MAG: hypothetical protein GWP08_01720 [Nitrospiraceae bacterium]|nr:hypothetical protein [Nitrospiraceae bacterium]